MSTLELSTAVHFSEQELELAQQLKAMGLGWTPACGQYVLDQNGLIECESPFQGRIFYILDLKHFLRRSETLENLKENMCWLPTWEQARGLLKEHGVSDQQVAQRLVEKNSIERGIERLELYRFLADVLHLDLRS